MIATTHILDILEEAKVEPIKAKAIARALEENEKELTSSFRKEFIGKEESGRIEVKIEQLRADLEVKVEQLKADLEIKMEQLRSDLIKWFVAIAVSQAIVVLGGVVFITSHSRL